MINLFDNHNHSQFSFDGWDASVEDGARVAQSIGLGGICFSEHCDFFVPPQKFEFEKYIPENFEPTKQQAEIDRVQKILEAESDGRHVPKILKGIEIGLYDECHDQIREKLAENSFDQVIASVHYLEHIDPYLGGYYQGKDWKRAYGLYLETIYKELTWLGDFDIMGHYDYVARYAPYPETSILYKDFSDILDELLCYLAQEGKALEINTKSYTDFDGRTPMLDKNILLRYKELGGEVISLGSDSHSPDRIGESFGYYAALLKSLGFRWTAHFEKRRLIQLPL